jgi:hypothetical protein
LLGKIIANVVNGTFRQLKYEGGAASEKDQKAARAQLAILRDQEAISGWTNNHQIIEVWKDPYGAAAGIYPEETILGKAKDSLEIKRFKNHVEQVVGLCPPEVSTIKQEIKVAANFATIKGKDKGAVLLACLELLHEAATLGGFKQLISFLIGAAGYLKTPPEIDKCLRDLAKQTRLPKNEAILFTTTTDDPKLLLMGSVMVDAISCFDYRYGSEIPSLLADVIDANVKLVLSYAIQEKHFSSPKEYEEAKNLIAMGVKPQFFPVEQSLKLGPITINLGRAYKRRRIKLGRTDKQTAGIRDEFEYKQTHFAEAYMNRQVEMVLTEMRRKSKAESGRVKIYVPPSRNPLGVYSTWDNGEGGNKSSLAHSVGFSEEDVKKWEEENGDSVLL